MIPSPLLTAEEVARWLRLVDDGSPPEQVASAVRSVHRLVREERLRPVRPGRSYVFSVHELERFVRDETFAQRVQVGQRKPPLPRA
jgi:hypothetical protein